MEVTVIITTWGSQRWRDRGASTARWMGTWNDCLVVHHHALGLVSAGAARNEAVERVDPKAWICFLDADDGLAVGYLQAMEAAHDHDRQLLTPALKLGDQPARVLDDRDIINGMNPCPIGTLIHRDLFNEVGGFGDWDAFEDYAMFQRSVLIGAEIKFVPDAIYLASHNPSGRNSTVRNPKRLVRQIREANQQWLSERA